MTNTNSQLCFQTCSSCGDPLSQEELQYYGSVCDNCEARLTSALLSAEHGDQMSTLKSKWIWFKMDAQIWVNKHLRPFRRSPRYRGHVWTRNQLIDKIPSDEILRRSQCWFYRNFKSKGWHEGVRLTLEGYNDPTLSYWRIGTYD